MKTPKGTLSPRQEELMLFLWDKDVSLIATQMAEAMKEKGWNNVTLFKTVQALTENNFLEVKGLEKAVKTYARKLAPSMTRAEYYRRSSRKPRPTLLSAMVIHQRCTTGDECVISPPKKNIKNFSKSFDDSPDGAIYIP